MERNTLMHVLIALVVGGASGVGLATARQLRRVGRMLSCGHGPHRDGCRSGRSGLA